MNIPDEFADIRPFEPEELPEVYERLLHNEQFLAVLHYLFPQQPVEQIAALMRQQSTNLDFQRTFCYPFLENLLREKSTGCTIDASAVDTKRNYTFVSNHRDIVLDSALLDKLLIDAVQSSLFITLISNETDGLLLRSSSSALIASLAKSICGDVSKDVSKYKYLTPVPGGVGQMTVYSIYDNLLKAYKLGKKNDKKNIKK